jgi:hypothetical protein
MRFPRWLMTTKCKGCASPDPHDAHLTKLYRLWLQVRYGLGKKV